MLLVFFEEYLGLALDVIPAFKSNDFSSWIQIVERLVLMMTRLGKSHYRDTCLILLSRLDYWQVNNHPILDEFKRTMPEFSEEPVELFFSGNCHNKNKKRGHHKNDGKC